MELNTNIDSGDVKIRRSADGKETTVTKEPDLVTRVSQFKEEEKEPTGEQDNKPEFDFKEIENIKDPEAKVWAQKAYKSFEKGYQEKFQKLAAETKALKSQQAQIESWTPERLQQEMNKPDFISAAQGIIKTQNQETDEYSALSEKEREKLQKMEQELATLRQQTSYSKKLAEDEQLRTKYADYNPQAVDILTADLINGKVQATREHLYKVLNYEDAVKKAYELGKSDRKKENEEKMTSMSPEGTTAQSTEGALEKEKGESNKQWFMRNALNRLVKSKEMGQIRK